MKKLAIIGIIALAGFYGSPDAIMSLLGFGKAKYGMTDVDPLGTVEKVHGYLLSLGFDGDLGTVGKARTISYKSPGDSQQFPGWGAGLSVVVGQEEYIQRIQAVFVSTQRGYTPQKAGAIERAFGDLWITAGGSAKPGWRKVHDGTSRMSLGGKYGNVTFKSSHMEATYDGKDISGKWMYSDDSPHEYAELVVK